MLQTHRKYKLRSEDMYKRLNQKYNFEAKIHFVDKANKPLREAKELCEDKKYPVNIERHVFHNLSQN
jgi:hypothetical protein